MNLLRLTFCAIIVLSFEYQKCYAIPHFGCPFEDPLTFKIDKGGTDHLYANLTDPAFILNDHDFDEVMTGIRTIIDSFLKNSIFNSMSSYQKLCSNADIQRRNGFLKDTDESCIKFLSEYAHQDIVGSGGYISVLYRLLRRIIRDYERFTFNFYFAIGYGNAPKNLAINLRVTQKLPSDFKHNFISGVLKFTKYDFIGYLVIIVDPEDGDISHFIVYENNPGTHTNVNGNIEFEFIGGALKYMIRAEKINGPDRSNNKHFVINVEKPYCSIIKASRAEVFLPRRSLVKRDSDGQKELSIFFDFPSLIINVVWYSPFVAIRSYDRHVKDVFKSAKQNLAPRFNLTEEQLSDLVALKMTKKAIFLKYYIQFARELNGIIINLSDGASSSSAYIAT